MNIKEFVKENKKKLMITGATIVGGVGVYCAIKHYGKVKAPDIDYTQLSEDVVKASSGIFSKTPDLPKPNWGIRFIVDEHWKNTEYTNMMILDTFAPDLGDLGKNLMNDFNVNPDIPISLIMEYSPNL